MHHILGNKVLEYDVDDRGVIVDEREIDRTVNPKPNIADWVLVQICHYSCRITTIRLGLALWRFINLSCSIPFPPNKPTDSPSRI